MNTRNKKESSTLTLVEAIETLSNIADLEFDREVGIAQKHDLIVRDKPLSYHTVHWLHHKNGDVTINMVKNTFRIVLNYLRNFYSKEYGTIRNEQAIEGIKTIMVLVGEAAKKLDKYTSLFHQTQAGSVTELKEYKKLQDFYLSRIARKIDEGVLGKWIMALSNKVHAERGVKLAGRKSGQTKHVFVDLESVKKDSEYELFFMRKEDGTRFFSPRLIRNIKLVSDFGDYFGEERADDPLVQINVWQDRFAHACAKSMCANLRVAIDKFYRGAAQYRENEYVEMLNKTLMALLLSANPHNLSHNLPIKNCRDYFHDFQHFLRETLRLNEYHRLITYPPKKSSKLAHCLLDTTHAICMMLYTSITGMQSLSSLVHGLIEQANDERSKEHQNSLANSRDLWNGLANDYAAMTALLKRHPNGPINKILDALQEGNCREYDPLMQDNIPSQLYTLYVQERKITFARWPTPTTQDFIHKAAVADEFKGFIRGCAHDRNISKCLLFNLQDRSSWKEHFRSLAIEDLPNHESYTRHIDVVTLAKDTEFYHQLAPYHLDNHATTFIKHFKEHLCDENSGFVFPESIKKVLFGGFIDGIMEGIHRIFFSGKNMMLREHRMDFIEIFYFFLQLKIVELSKADIVGFTCKDSIDIGQSASMLLFVFSKLLNQERLSESDREHLDLMIYGPCLLMRERVMQPERFNRLLNAIKAIETVRDQLGQKNFVRAVRETFGSFFKTPMLQSKIVVQSGKS